MPATTHKKEERGHRVHPGVLAVSCLVFASFPAGCSDPKNYGIDPETHTVRKEIPTSFVAQAKFISVGTDMVLKDDKGDFGKIQERVLSFGKTFEYFDAQNNVKAKAKQQVLSFGVKINITDENGTALGSIEENVFKSLFKVKTSYAIKDPAGAVIGISDKTDWAGTKIEIKDTSGNMVAKMERPYFDLGAATWDVEMTATPRFDKRLVLFIPAFKTSADNSRK